MRSFITQSLAKYLYKTLIEPVFTYCDFIYDGCYQYDKDKLQIAQNNSLRVSRLHEELQIEYLSVARQKSTIKMTFQGIHNLNPSKINELFEIYTPARSLRSENKQILLPPRTRTKFAENNIVLRGSNYWNILDEK